MWWGVRKELFAKEFQLFVEASAAASDNRSISVQLREAALAAINRQPA